MKRFISVSLAALLGYVSSAELEQLEDRMFLNQEGPAKTSVRQKLDEYSENLQRLNCLLYDDLTFFDLRKLEQNSDNTYTAYGSNLLDSGVGREYHVNFCRRFVVSEDGKDYKTFAYTTSGLPDSQEVRLTGSGKPSYTETVLKDVEEDSVETHILFVQSGGEACPHAQGDKKKNYEVEYEVFCDPSVTEKPTIKVDDTDLCRPKITLTHKAGCPVF